MQWSKKMNTEEKKKLNADLMNFCGESRTMRYILRTASPMMI